MELSTLEAIIRILAALVCGGIVGLERELSMHPAGLRTHILVCIGAAVFTILSVSGLSLGLETGDALPTGVDYRIVRDPGRIAAQIVTGIGFIGGGAVLRHGATVRGLTTAASLWMIASVGMLAGAGYYLLAGISTLISFAVLFLLGKVGRNLTQKHQKAYNRLRMLATINPIHTNALQSWIDRHFEERVIEFKNTSSGEDQSTLTYIIDVEGQKIDVNEISRKVNALTGISSTGIRLYYHSPDTE